MVGWGRSRGRELSWPVSAATSESFDASALPISLFNFKSSSLAAPSFFFLLHLTVRSARRSKTDSLAVTVSPSRRAEKSQRSRLTDARSRPKEKRSSESKLDLSELRLSI